MRPLVRAAKSGRPILVLDGCPLHCVAKILQRHGLEADKHVDLSKLGVKKRKHEDFDPEEAARVLRQLIKAPDFPGHTKPGSSSSTSGKSADDEMIEYSSPPCYLSEFKDREGIEP